MKRRGQVVRLKNLKTQKVIEVRIIQFDSIQGYWAEPANKSNRDWKWYPPTQWEKVK